MTSCRRKVFPLANLSMQAWITTISLWYTELLSPQRDPFPRILSLLPLRVLLLWVNKHIAMNEYL